MNIILLDIAYYRNEGDLDGDDQAQAIISILLAGLRLWATKCFGLMMPYVDTDLG